MTTATHRHRVKGDPIDVAGYSGPINGAIRRNSKADGASSVVERCSCGARRVTNINANEREYGPWVG